MTSILGASQAPILQLHLSRHCNLACRHCYSESGPRAKGRLELHDGFYEQAFEWGYRVVSLSGGEPYLDPAMPRHVERARAAGLRVNLVSNGTLIDEAWAEWTARNVELVAISLDGLPDRHDFIRGKSGAFDLAMTGLRQLRKAGASVGVIHTATKETLSHLRWLLGLVREEGISLVQLHPLEEVGRAATELSGEASYDLPSRLAYLARLLASGDGLGIQVDVTPLEIVELLADEADGPPSDIAAFLNPLVVEADGRTVPWTFGVPEILSLGSVTSAPLGNLLRDYANSGASTARQYQREVARRVLGQPPWPFVNWYAELTRARWSPMSGAQ